MSPGVYEWIGGCFGGMSIITIIKKDVCLDTKKRVKYFRCPKT